MDPVVYCPLEGIERALESVDDPPLVALWQARLAIELLRHGRSPQAARALALAETLAAPLADDASPQAALVGSWVEGARAADRFFKGGFAEAAERVDQALERWRSQLPEARVLEMTGQAALYRYANFERPAAVQRARAVLQAAQSPPFARFQAHFALATVLGASGMQAPALSHFKRALSAARETGDPFTVGSALIRMAASRAFEAWEQALDGLPDAEVLKQAIVGLHSTIEFWQSRDQHRPLHDMHLMLAELLVEQGRLDEALALWEQHVPAARSPGMQSQWVQHQAHWARRLALAGHAERARALLEPLAELAPALPRGTLIRRAALHHLARTQAALGRREAALHGCRLEAEAVDDILQARQRIRAEFDEADLGELSAL